MLSSNFTVEHRVNRVSLCSWRNRLCVRVLAVKPSISKLCHKKQAPQLRSSPAKTFLALTTLLATRAKTGIILAMENLESHGI